VIRAPLYGSSWRDAIRATGSTVKLLIHFELVVATLGAEAHHLDRPCNRRINGNQAIFIHAIALWVVGTQDAGLAVNRARAL
jgi:hypothetical protein